VRLASLWGGAALSCKERCPVPVAGEQRPDCTPGHGGERRIATGRGRVALSMSSPLAALRLAISTNDDDDDLTQPLRLCVFITPARLCVLVHPLWLCT
jgi:hypothetical protein